MLKFQIFSSIVDVSNFLFVFGVNNSACSVKLVEIVTIFYCNSKVFYRIFSFIQQYSI